MKNPNLLGGNDRSQITFSELVKTLPPALFLVLLLFLADAGILPAEAFSPQPANTEQMPGDTDGASTEIGSGSEIYPLPPGTEVAQISLAGGNLAVTTTDGRLFVLHVNTAGEKVLDQLFASGVRDVSVSADGNVAFSLRWENLGKQGIVIWSPDGKPAAFHEIPVGAEIGSVELVQGGLVVYELTLNGVTSLYYAFLEANGHISSGPIEVLFSAELTNLSSAKGDKGLVALGSLVTNQAEDGSDVVSGWVVISTKEGKFQLGQITSFNLFDVVSDTNPDLYRVLSTDSGVYGAIVDGDSVRVKQVNPQTMETPELPRIDLGGFVPTKLFINEVPASTIPGQTGENILLVSVIGEDGEMKRWILSNGKTWQLLPAGTKLSSVNTLEVTGGQAITAKAHDNNVVVEGILLRPELVFLSRLFFQIDQPDLEII